MASEWRTCRWGDLATLEYGRGLRGYRDGEGAFPVFGTNGQIGWHTEPLCNHAGVIIGRKGVYRGIHYSDRPFFVIDTAFYLEPKTEFDMRWAHYQLLTHDINAMDSGSAIPSTSRDEFYTLPVIVPPLPEQRAIAHILGTLDDKIELNQRINETLEAIARAIFKSWFVDFDPVRAKAEGRDPPGMDAETAALFPHSLEDSILGKIPAGWKTTKVGEILEFAYGKALTESNRRPGPVPVYGSNGQVGWHDEPLVGGPGIVVGRKGNPGIVTWAPTAFHPIDTTFYVVSKGEVHSLHYLYHALSFLDLPSLGADSAVPGLNRNMAYMSDILVPSGAALEAFGQVRSALCARALQNDSESRTLAALRDALLPKLISGKLRVKDAERFSAEVMS